MADWLFLLRVGRGVGGTLVLAMSEPLEMWTVSVADGEGQHHILAETWECGGNGLCFLIGEEKIAWFTQWRYFYKNAPLEPSEAQP